MKYILPYTTVVVIALGLWGCSNSNNNGQQHTRNTPPWMATTRPKTLAYDPTSGVPSAVAYRLGFQVWEEKSKGRWGDVTQQLLDEDRKRPKPPSHIKAPGRQYMIWGDESTVRAIVRELVRCLRSWDPQRLRSVLQWDGYGLDDPVLGAAEAILRKSDVPELHREDELVFLMVDLVKPNDLRSIHVHLNLATVATKGGVAEAREALVARFTDAVKSAMPGDNVKVSFHREMTEFLANHIGACRVGDWSRREITETPVGTFTGKWKEFKHKTTIRQFSAPNIGCVDRYVDGEGWLFDYGTGRTVLVRMVVDGLVLRLKDKVVVKKLDSKQ